MSVRSFPVIVVNDTRVDRHHGCSRVMSALEELISAIGGKINHRSSAHSDWSTDRLFEPSLAQARLMVINGEGTIHHDRPAGKRLLEAAFHAKSLGVPVALVNAGWESNGPELTSLVDAVDVIAVRDSRSASQLRLSGKACRVVPDLSLYGGFLVHACGPRQGVGFTDSVDAMTSLSLDLCRRKSRGRPVAIQFSEPGLKGKVRFLRESISRRDVADPRRAAKLLRARTAQLGAQVADAGEFIASLAALELLVSGRFHACTLSLLAGTPFVAVASNTAKIAALIEDAGLQSWRSLERLDERAVDAARREGWSPTERSSIEDYLSFARQGADDLFAEIGRLV